MLFCVHCGVENPEIGNFCRKCGKALVKDASEGLALRGTKALSAADSASGSTNQECANNRRVRTDASQIQLFETESERAKQLISEQPNYWEYLLAAELIESKLSAILTLPPQMPRTCSPQNLNAPEFLEWIASKLQEPTVLVQRIMNIITTRLMSAAGGEGDPASPGRILRAANEIEAFCRELCAWEAEVCSARAPSAALKEVVGELEGLSAETIEQFLELPRSLVRAVNSEPATPRPVNINLKIKAPSQVARYVAAMQRFSTKQSIGR